MEQDLSFLWIMLGCSVFNVIVWEIFFKKNIPEDEYWQSRFMMFLGSLFATIFIVASPLFGKGGDGYGGGA